MTTVLSQKESSFRAVPGTGRLGVSGFLSLQAVL